MRSGYWQDRTTADFRHLDPETTVALLPVAAVEQHGPHLPLITDALINDGLVRAALALVSSRPTLLVLPALSVGLSPEHTSFPGTLAIADSTLADGWTDVGRSVARAGVRKLVILNTHGGQKALVDLVAMRLRADSRCSSRVRHISRSVRRRVFSTRPRARTTSTAAKSRRR